MKNVFLKKISGICTLITLPLALAVGYWALDGLLSSGMQLRRFEATLQGGKYLTCKNVPFQESTGDCGLKSLEAVFNYFGQDVDLSHYSVDKFYSLSELQQIARTNGLYCEGWSLPFDSLSVPAILLLNNSHFVIVVELFEEKARIIDPALGQMLFTKSQLESKWTNKALIFSEERR